MSLLGLKLLSINKNKKWSLVHLLNLFRNYDHAKDNLQNFSGNPKYDE